MPFTAFCVQFLCVFSRRHETGDRIYSAGRCLFVSHSRMAA